MTWHTILNYITANWLEIAGVITTVVGIWLTTRRVTALLAGCAGGRRDLSRRLLSGSAVV